MTREKPKTRSWSIPELEALREEIDTTIKVLKRLEGFSLGSPSGGILNSLPPQDDGDNGSGDTPVSVLSDTFFGLSKTDAAEKYLQMGKRPKSTKEISDALRKGGTLSKSKTFEVTVHTALTKNKKRFVRVGKEWGLTEWYGSGAKKKPQRPDEED